MRGRLLRTGVWLPADLVPKGSFERLARHDEKRHRPIVSVAFKNGQYSVSGERFS